MASQRMNHHGNPLRDLRRARCRDDWHAGFGKRLGETHRSKYRQGAPGRPHVGLARPLLQDRNMGLACVELRGLEPLTPCLQNRPRLSETVAHLGLRP
jgi:hypothetical protein